MPATVEGNLGAGLDLLPGAAGVGRPEDVAAHAEDQRAAIGSPQTAEEGAFIWRVNFGPGHAAVGRPGDGARFADQDQRVAERDDLRDVPVEAFLNHITTGPRAPFIG